MPITGLHFEQFPVNNRKYFAMATTPTRIYQFVGYIGPSSAGTSRGSPSFVESDDRGERAMFESMFSKYDINPGKNRILLYLFLLSNYILTLLTIFACVDDNASETKTKQAFKNFPVNCPTVNYTFSVVFMIYNSKALHKHLLG